MDIGKFVSENKMVMERYFPADHHPVALSEVEFPTPDVFIWKLMWRGEEVSWEPVWTYTWKSFRINE